VIKVKLTENGNPYNRFYRALDFERLGLFELIKEKYGCETVLYPGCSIHITPSFYFHHVVYVDISEQAKDFFSDEKNISSIVNSNKKYRQKAYIKFLNCDYTKNLPLREESFDLLISVYAGGVTQTCSKYVKRGGIIVSNNHQNDAMHALKDMSLELEALIRRKGRKYHAESAASEDLPKILKERKIPSDNMKKSSTGLIYTDNENYFLFRKKRIRDI